MATHNLTAVDLAARTAICRICGPTAIYVPKYKPEVTRRCITAHVAKLREDTQRQRERRAKTHKYTTHSIVKHDVDTNTGVCRICGPVVIRVGGKKAPIVCINAWKNYRFDNKGSHGLSRGEVYDRVNMIGRCQNRGCDKRIDRPGPGANDAHTDHNHKTGAVRGVLCGNCNWGLGHAADDTRILAGLRDYIKKPPGPNIEIQEPPKRKVRHVLLAIDKFAGTGTCSICGFTQIKAMHRGVAARMACILRWQEVHENKNKLRAEYKRGTRKYVNHMIFDYAEDTGTGVCRLCGPVAVKIVGRKKLKQCINVWNSVQDQKCHRLIRSDAVSMIAAAGRCQNSGCEKLLLGSGGQSDAGHGDHDHKTGAIRGVLCGACNRALGHLKDNHRIISGLIGYLREFDK